MTRGGSWMRSPRCWGTPAACRGCCCHGSCTACSFEGCPLQSNKPVVLALIKENFLIQVNVWACHQLVLEGMWGTWTLYGYGNMESPMSWQQSRTQRASWLSVHCPFTGLCSSLFAEITKVWLKIYQHFISLSDTCVLEISAYLQRVILVLHLYITSLARVLCSEQSPNGFTVTIIWNTESKQWWWQAKFCFQLYELNSIHCNTAKNR